MTTTYGQFCPVAKAMEILGERWTLHVMRELLNGSSRFNQLRRRNPKMSPALLSKRLHSLERAGLVTRSEVGGHAHYALTPAGRELEGIVEAIGAWGVRWVGELGDVDLDPHLLMWDMRRTVPVDSWPRARTVVAFELDGTAPRARRWWLVVAEGQVDVCDFDPGHEVAATVRSSIRDHARLWRGDIGWPAALRSGRVVVDARAEVQREVPRWLGQSSFAEVPRPVPV